MHNALSHFLAKHNLLQVLMYYTLQPPALLLTHSPLPKSAQASLLGRNLSNSF